MSRRIVWTWKQTQILEATKAVYVAIEFGALIIRCIWIFVSVFKWMCLALSPSLKTTIKNYKEYNLG